MDNTKELKFVPNPEQLSLLKQGVDVWNAWRKDNPEAIPYLNEANLSGMNLRKANFCRSFLQFANLENTDLTGADLRQAKLYTANLIGARLDGADLSNADLEFSFMDRARCIGANFAGAELGDAVLRHANFAQAKLEDAYLLEADLLGANFSFAKLIRTDFRWAKLYNVNFDGAVLENADFTGAHIGGTLFVNTDLSSVKGLDTLKHYQASSIGVDTLFISAGKIPEIFMRGCGFPDTFLANISSLIAAEDILQFYSCFISYSHKDEEFTKRLYSRMRDEHLRVWFAPEDVKGGQKLHEQIDRAIQVHDRLLIVLSEHSLQSEWVKTEIRKARRVEISENRRKLFPISLEPFDIIRNWECFDADSGKDLGVEIREYFIPDFSNWKDHDEFEEAFKRLLRDLRVVERL
jgi:uncharacterized protein YjbI with pentapeptide repeats